jgi:hypothetical protein
MKLSVTILIFFIVQISFAQIVPVTSTLEKKWEIFQDKVPVSGNVRVGLMVDLGGDKFNPEQFYVYLPKREDILPNTKLCAEFSSKDGRYSAKLDYTIGSKSKVINPVPLPTEFSKYLSKYKTDEVVILASLSNDCAKKPSAYVLSSWIDPKVIETDIVVVYINSISQTTLHIGNENDGECSTLDFPIVAYNKKCSIPLNVLKDKATIVIRQRRRRGSTTNFMEYKLFLRYAKN